MPSMMGPRTTGPAPGGQEEACRDDGRGQAEQADGGGQSAEGGLGRDQHQQGAYAHGISRRAIVREARLADLLADLLAGPRWAELSARIPTPRAACDRASSPPP